MNQELGTRNQESRTILVTGGAGFIGSHLCDRLLDQGHEVLCVDNFNDYYDPKLKEQNIAQAIEHPNFSLIHGDILEQALLATVDLYYKSVLEGDEVDDVRADGSLPAELGSAELAGAKLLP